MKRNQDRYWYDKGYTDGSKANRKDSKIPKVIGFVSVSTLLVFDQYWILGFVIMWALFELHEWRELDKWHECNPPEKWSDMDD